LSCLYPKFLASGASPPGPWLASIEVAIFVLLVTPVIWCFEDDAFQKWCQRCAFGRERMKSTDRCIDADKQLKAFNEALAEVR